jgi:NAD(P)-dependent dehydrogenase (short-subunit alcohol dehydrogenase family)
MAAARSSPGRHRQHRGHRWAHGSAEFTIGGSVNAALLNLTKALADRGVREGVRVNAVNPSAIATERTQVRIDRLAQERGISSDEAAAALARELRVARFGTPDEIATVVAFLCLAGAPTCRARSSTSTAGRRARSERARFSGAAPARSARRRAPRGTPRTP